MLTQYVQCMLKIFGGVILYVMYFCFHSYYSVTLIIWAVAKFICICMKYIHKFIIALGC